jgi:hydrogenase expression/formation protein HypC
MCLAIPARVVSIDPATDTATVALGGSGALAATVPASDPSRRGGAPTAGPGAVTKGISLALVDGVVPGDYVLVHVGYALSRISSEEAERTLALMAEVAQFAGPPMLAATQGGEGAP